MPIENNNESNDNIVFKDIHYYGSIPAKDNLQNTEQNNIDENNLEPVDVEMTAKTITINNTNINRKNSQAVVDWFLSKPLFKKKNSSNATNTKIYVNDDANITADDLTEIGDDLNMEWPYDSNADEEGEDEDDEDEETNYLRRGRTSRHRDNSIIATIKLDFRRYHHSTEFTKQEVYRSFLDTFNSRNDEQFLKLVDQYSQSNHLIGDEILTQATFDYLRQDLGLNLKTEVFKLEYRIYDFAINLKFISEDNKNSETLPLIEPCYQNCLKNSLESYILGDNNFKDYNIEAEYIDVGIASRSDFNDLDSKKLKGKIHLIKRDDNMGLDSQISNSISYGAIGCIVYNQNGYSYEEDTVFYHPNETITRDYLINDLKVDIPVIPVSFNVAQDLLAKKGKLQMTREKKSNKSFKRKNNNGDNGDDGDGDSGLLTNFFTTIPGVWNDHEIIIGVQRDTFSYNGFNSGHLIFLQLCKGFSELMARGWKPIRTIRLISFDGNNLNNFGVRNQYLKNSKNFDNSMVYIDIDKESITGDKQFKCETTYMFKDIIEDTLKMVSVSDNDENEDYDLTDFFDKDFTFVDMNTKSLAYELFYKKNIPTVSCKFADDNKTFPHNSNFLTREFIENQVDTENYKLHKLLAKFYGLLALALDESEVIPYSTGKFIENIASKFKEISKDNYKDILEWEYISDCLKDLTIIFNSFDLYNKRLLKLAYLDYPWYKGLRKLKLLFKIKNSNKKLFVIKNLFISSIRKQLNYYNVLKFDNKIIDETYHSNLLYQENVLEGGKIMAFGKLKELLLLNDRDGLIDYLKKLHKDLREIKKFALDAYPI
ncbi:hypothetical protein ACO0SA_001622 [Hanseniaspora valbyensis]